MQSTPLSWGAKCSQYKTLKRNKEGHGIQPQSHKAALLMNTTRALWGCCEYREDTHPTTLINSARASIAAMRARQMQTATFCQPAKESRVARSTQWWQLSSLSAWPTRAPEAPWQWQLLLWQAQQQEESPECEDKGFKPWCLHGEQANHSYEECCANPCNQSAQTTRTTTHNNNKNTAAWHVHHASRARHLLDKQQIKLPGIASDMVSIDERTRAGDNNNKYHFW